MGLLTRATLSSLGLGNQPGCWYSATATRTATKDTIWACSNGFMALKMLWYSWRRCGGRRNSTTGAVMRWMRRKSAGVSGASLPLCWEVGAGV